METKHASRADWPAPKKAVLVAAAARRAAADAQAEDIAPGPTAQEKRAYADRLWEIICRWTEAPAHDRMSPQLDAVRVYLDPRFIDEGVAAGWAAALAESGYSVGVAGAIMSVSAA